MQTYQISSSIIAQCGILRSPFFMIREGVHPLDETALLAGLVKTIRDRLETEISYLARLTTPTYPQQEERAKMLLDALIDGKRAYLQSQQQER